MKDRGQVQWFIDRFGSTPGILIFGRVVWRAWKQIRSSFAYTATRLLFSNLSCTRFRKLLMLKDESEQKAWTLEFRATLKNRTIFPSPVLQSLEIDFPNDTPEILEKADSIKAHVFHLLGPAPVKVFYRMSVRGFQGHRYEMHPEENQEKNQKIKMKRLYPGVSCGYTPIDWYIDFRSGYRWSEGTWFSKIRYGTPGADIKIPWELSRFQHGVILGQAYRLSIDETYSRELIHQIIDWIAANRLGYGPNWACPMDVSIRAVNWLISLSLIHDSPELTDDVLWTIAKSLHQHGTHIRRNLEWSPKVNGNHYLTDIAGLYFIGQMCSQLPKAKRWKSFAKVELEREILRQVYEDGCNFEGSTCYHRLATELFFYPALLGSIAGDTFSKEYLNRLDAMFSVVSVLLHGDGTMPQIGDNDSGRFVILENPNCPVLKMNYLVSIGNWFFEKELLGPCGASDKSALRWIDNRKDKEIRKPRLDRGSESAILLKNAGWAVLKNDSVQAVISCGSNGQNGVGGHAHNDKLSIEVSVSGIPLIVDPGTFVYTSDILARNKYRSTSAHNTPQLNDIEQNQIVEGLPGAFVLVDRSEATVVRLEENYFEGKHKGFGEWITMRLTLREHELFCEYQSVKGSWVMRWVLHPEVVIQDLNDGLSLARAGISALLSTKDNNFQIENQYYSPEYGVIVPCKYIVHPFGQNFGWKLSVLG